MFCQLFLADEQQLSLARSLEEVVPLGDGGVSEISVDPTVPDTADYMRGAFYWHIDGASDPRPPRRFPTRVVKR